MSQFDFPRINFSGNTSINVGTGNNSVTNTAFQMTNPNTVEALMQNMTDEGFMEWCITPNSGYNNQMPASWNYYGTMGVNLQNVLVTAIQTNEQTLQTKATENDIIGSELSLDPACMTDVDPLGVANSQIFSNTFSLTKAGKTYVSAKPSKSSTRWINFQRNICLNASAGASATFQFVLTEDLIKDSALWSYFKDNGQSDKTLAGITVRLNLYGFKPKISNEQLEKNYKNAANLDYQTLINPSVGQVVGTIAPWYEGEMKTVTLARLLNTGKPLNNPNFNGADPSKSTGNGPFMPIAPALAKVNNGYVSLDLSNSFPEGYELNGGSVDYEKAITNKWNFGKATLMLKNEVIGEIPYQDMTTYLNQGGMYDFKIPDHLAAEADTADLSVVGEVENSGKTTQISLLNETEYMFATDQNCIYAEEDQKTALYTSDGLPEPVVIQGAKRGVLATKANPIEVNVLQFISYQTNPTSFFYNEQSISCTIPNVGSPIKLFNDRAGIQMFKIALVSEVLPAAKTALNPAIDAYITLRVLPFDDYTEYLNGTKEVTWDFLYNEVLRYYRLIYPGMNMVMPFAEADWKSMVSRINGTVGADLWNSVQYMPRTRDLSDSRRKLIQAWCQQVMTPPKQS